jgi:tetratricopeptide (TPR) repeat protein
MKTGYFYIIFSFLYFLSFSANAQRISDDNTQKSRAGIEREAESFLQEGKFEKALALYRKLYNEDEENPRLNFLLGYTYLNTGFGLDKAIDYLLRATELTTSKPSDKAPLEAYYYLALAYHQNQKYKMAVDYLDILLIKIPQSNQFFRKQVTNLKEYCYNAQMFAQSSIKVDVQNIFELNSKYSDKNPLLFNDGKEIIFTSRRETLRRGKKNKKEELDDNVYHSRYENGEWTAPTSIANINTVDDESACWVSKDGSFLIIQRIEKGRSNLYYSNRISEREWTIPKEFADPVNSRNNETYGSLSPDGKTLFFTSDRRGGFGGIDIYMSEKKGDNIWGEPKNLGENINTEFNEESPLLHENGVLFFCSQGHVSMGGFDIFTSFLDAKTGWTKAANLGSPINTINDDFFYQPMPHGQYAFTSSMREGTKGQSDIFKYYVNDSTGKGYALVAGKVNCSKNIEFDRDVKVVVRDMDKYKVKTYQTNRFGDFALVVSAATNYEISYSYKKQVFYQAVMKFPKSNSYLANEQSVRLKDVTLDLYDDTEVVRADKVKGNVDVYASVEKTTKTIKEGPEIVAKELAEKNKGDIAASLNPVEENEISDSAFATERYSIKLISSESKMLLSFFTGINNVKEQFENGRYIYYFGNYKYEWEAEIELRLIHENYPEASIFVNKYGKQSPN